MALITRCPACATLFKVVPDQLRISAGWVRCGHCRRVFDARKNLQDPESAPPPLPDAPDAPKAAPVAPSAAVAATAEPPAPSSGTRRATADEMTQFRALFEQISAQQHPEGALSAPAPMPETVPAPAALRDAAAGAEGGEPEEGRITSLYSLLETGDSESAGEGPERPASGSGETDEEGDGESSAPARVAEAEAGNATHQASVSAAQEEEEDRSVAPPAETPPGGVDFLLSGIGSYLLDPEPAAAPAPQPGPEPQPQAEESPALPMAAQPAHESARDERQPVQPPLFMPSVPFDPDEWPLEPPPSNKPPARPAPLDIPAAPLTPSAPAQPALAAAEAAPKSRVDGKPSEKASRRASDKASDKAHGKSAGKTRKTAPETPKAPKSPAPHRQRPETAEAAAAAEPSFVREARQRAMWQRPGVRLAMGGAFGLLALALAVQVAIHNRSWLAARAPATRPVLTALCLPLGCKVEPYRLLDAIVIDSSSFVRTSANTFNLSFGLRNTADLPVATPSLELTLSNGEGKTVLRRVLPPAEQGASAEMAARGEFTGAVTLTVDGDAADPAAIVGYRLTAFYP